MAWRIGCNGIVLVACAGVLAGCTAPARDGEVATASFADVSHEQRDTLWDAAQDVLREQQFRLDWVDRRSGSIRTQPLTSQQAFEFWRKDVDTSYDLLEATMRTVRRTVDVTLAGGDAGETLTVTVRREYFSTPERQFNSSIAGMRMFTTDLPRADTGEQIKDSDSRWIDAGRDPAMERYLLERIVTRAGGRAA